MHSAVGIRAVPSLCMTGPLGDALMFTNGSCPARMDLSGMSDEKETASSKQCSTIGSSIEWQILKDGVNANANPSKFSDTDCRFAIFNQKQFMASVSPWDCGVEGRVVNYLQSFEHSNSSGCSVDGQLGEIRLTLDGGLLNNVVRKGRNAAEVIERDDEDFGADSPTTRSHILGGNCSGQQLFARGLGIPSSASMQQLNRSPNHAIRNLFPEQSSSFSSGMSREDLDIKGDEQLHLTKKARTQDYMDGTLTQAGVDANRLNHPGRYRESFPRDQRSSSVASLPSFKIPTTPCLSSLTERSTFISNLLPSLQNSSLSSFQNAAPPPPPKNANESVSLKSSLIDYDYSNETKIQGGFSRCAPPGGLLVPDRNSFRPLNLMDLPSPPNDQPTPGRNFMQSSSLGQVCSRRQSTLDSGGRGAWPAGFINFPSLSIESGAAATILPSRPALHELEQTDGQLEGRETRRGHSISESRTRLVIQKQLTTTDVGSLGRIILPKKEAETHLPHLPDKEGIEMCLYDYDVERTWIMKYRFWPNNKSRMYLLENTGEFSKFHGLQQGDLLLIYLESPSRYVLRAKKMAPPLLPVTPPQSVTEAGGPAAEDLGPASAGGRTVSTGGSSSTKEVCGTSSASSSRQPSSDVPSSAFRSSSAGAKSLSSSHVVDGKSASVRFVIHKHHNHQPGVKAAEDHHQQQHCLKSCMADQQNDEMPAELDGEGIYNLEEFPSLIEAEDLFTVINSDSDLSAVENNDYVVVRSRAARLEVGLHDSQYEPEVLRV